MKRSTVTGENTYEDIHSPVSIISRRGLFSLSCSLNEGIERNTQICAKLSKHARLISPDKKDVAARQLLQLGLYLFWRHYAISGGL